MTDPTAALLPPPSAQVERERVRVVLDGERNESVGNDSQAIARLGDGPFIAYAMLQGFKVTAALFVKRWPMLSNQARVVK